MAKGGEAEALHPANKDVLEILDNNKSYKSFANEVREKFPGILNFSDDLGIYAKATRIQKKIKELKRNHKRKEAMKLLGEPFNIIKESNFERSQKNLTKTEKVLNLDLNKMKCDNKILKRKNEDLRKEKINLVHDIEILEEEYTKSIEEYKLVSDELIESLKGEEISVKETERLKLDLEKKSDKLDQVEAKYADLQSKYKTNCVRNLNKKIKRRDAKIDILEQQLSEKVSADEERVTELEKLKIKELKLNEKIKQLKRKNTDLSKESNVTDERYVSELENKLKVLQTQNKELNNLVSLLEDEEIVTFQDGRYLDEVREVIMELLSLNVSMSKVNTVIRVVLGKLAGKPIGRLPSNAVKSRLLVEARYLAKYHVAEEMIQNEGNCLHGDGTTKYHKHYQNFQITLSNGKQLSLGLKEMAGGDSAASMKAFREIIDDLSDTIISNEQDQSVTIAKLITSIKCTMSDHGPTNPCFNKQLKILREELLPLITDNWNELNKDSQESLARMCNFYCKMHLLPNLATECDKTLKIFEGICQEDSPSSDFFNNESGTARLVRTTAKSFHHRGCDEAGVAAYFNSFLTGKDQSLKLISYKGSRFNVLFYDAAATYFHRQHIIEFLKKWPNQNRLLQSVAKYIENPILIAGIRALGIIDKIVTGPFWRLLESDIKILDLNPYLLQMKIYFEKWSRDASPLLDREVLFSDVEIHKDDLYDSLFETDSDPERQQMTIQCLEMCMHALLIILERQAEDQLPGGIYGMPHDETKENAENVPTTNKISEKEFASLDLLVRTKPACTTIAQEALIMWTHNNTREWLDLKSEEEKKLLLEGARKSFANAISKYQDRKKYLKEENIKRLLKKQEEKENGLKRKQTLKVQSTNDLLHLGLSIWTTEIEVDTNLEKLSENEKMKKLVAQIKFHKNVLKSKGTVKLFAQSTTVKGVKHTYNSDELCDHLKEIIKPNPVSSGSETTSSSIVSSSQRSEKIIDAKKKLLQQLAEQRIKQQVSKSKFSLASYVENPKELVGKKVKHKCVTDDGAVWFCGIVVKLAEQNGMNSEYMIKYEDDPEDVEWMFPLLKDLKRGDLITLWFLLSFLSILLN